MNHTRRAFLKCAGGLAAAGMLGRTSILGAESAKRKPNIVVIFTDDQGYGDLGCYGHPTIRTPHIDRMAAEGLRFTDFYAAAPVCTPSRAALLTGRYAVRSGMTYVLFPHHKHGLPQSEVTLGSALKEDGYATAMIGKWHLGIVEGSRPQDHGFDYTYQVPYSNDMDRRNGVPLRARYSPDPPADGWNVPIIRNGEIIERPADQATLTKRYTEESINFIQSHKDKPFFLYLAHTMPHTPLFRSGQFKDTSLRGLYGDVIEELDWSTGRILDTLRSEGLAEDTLVIYTSDNGPWLSEFEQGGCAGLLRAGKGTTWEGGMRVPAIAWMPGRVRPGVTSEVACTLDVLPTALALAGAPLPEGVKLDGMDIGQLLFEGKSLPERPFFYYRGREAFACRIGAWKAHFITKGAFGIPGEREQQDPPLLFNLYHDPSERFNRAEDNPQVIERMRAALKAHQKTIG